MIRPFHTLPDIMELGLLVAKIQNGSGADREVDEAVTDLFFTRARHGIGWDNPLTGKWIGNPDFAFTHSIDGTLRIQREFLPETTWMIDAQAELPARAIVRHGPEFKVRTAPTPERALLTAFLVVCDQIQRAAA
ncbi:MAG: hypothetical protein LCH80_05470 [Proteobacteria bacterium]|nr:hypothetical protein [Pseudomonadota bacterium]